jgi:hypothetical protein
VTEAVQRCAVCEHPSVLGINAAILNGKSFRAIARDFKIGSERSGTFTPDHKKVSRHAERCMATSYQQIQETNLTTQGKAIQARLQYLDEQVDLAIADAREGEVVMVGDAPMLDADGQQMRRRSAAHLRVLLAAVREGRHNQALIAKLAGALPDEDGTELEAMKRLLESPEARRLVQQLEEVLAAEAQAEGRNKIES